MVLIFRHRGDQTVADRKASASVENESFYGRFGREKLGIFSWFTVPIVQLLVGNRVWAFIFVLVPIFNM
jgi:hypothetical protein